MSNTSGVNSGAILEIKNPSAGKYTVTQLSQDQRATLPAAPGDQDFSITIGIVTLSGTINLTTFALVVHVSVLGINIGTFSGSAKDGITININLFAVSGTIRLFMKNGNELWGHIHLTPIIGPVVDEEFLIIKF